MSHMPVNHHLRPLYRVLAMLSGLYLIIFGILALGNTKDQTLWAKTDLVRTFGQHANRGLALISIVVGAIVLLAALAGRNIDRYVNYWVAIGLFLLGTLMLGLIRFGNVFGASGVHRGGPIHHRHGAVRRGDVRPDWLGRAGPGRGGVPARGPVVTCPCG